MSDEGGHWYTEDGTPCHTVIGRNGVERNTTLYDAKRLSLKPSVTTVDKDVRAKPALVKWQIDQGILAALTLPRIAGEDEAAFLERVREDAKRQAREAAEEGTRIHRAVEAHFRGEAYPDKYRQHVAATLAEIKRLFPDVNDWVSEKTFAHPLGYGGSVDLHSPSTGHVIDYKGKDGTLQEVDARGNLKRLAYDQNVQLAAYQVGLLLQEPPYDGMVLPSGAMIGEGYRRISPCANIFISRTHPGAVRSHVWPAEDVAKGWRIFQCALALWKEVKEYDASFQPEPEAAL